MRKFKPFSVRPIEFDDLILMEARNPIEQESIVRRLDETWDDLNKDGFTGTFGDRIGLCSGFIEQWPGRAVVWTLIADFVKGPLMLPVHRHVFSILESYQPRVFRRVEMTVYTKFGLGHKWAKMLGFQFECNMAQYSEDGDMYSLYSRVRN